MSVGIAEIGPVESGLVVARGLLRLSGVQVGLVLLLGGLVVGALDTPAARAAGAAAWALWALDVTLAWRQAGRPSAGA